MIEQQTYADVEVVISDDASSDDTEQQIGQLQAGYKYPIIYHRNPANIGYDANYRKSIELATGEYCMVIGNDDSLLTPDSLQYLADFLHGNQYPEIGFCNFVEDHKRHHVIARANTTGVLGTGCLTALRNYSCFSFVGGLIYKRSAFVRYNTNKHDGSIYSQMYLGCLMIASGCRLFSIEKPLVLKDLAGDEKQRKSYRDTIAREWRNYRVVDGGLPSVINVLISAFRDSGALTQPIIFTIFKRIYTVTYPYWLMDYRSLNAMPEAVGLMRGLKPNRNGNYRLLSYTNRGKILALYCIYSTIGLLTPTIVYAKAKDKIYRYFKKRG